VGEEMLPTSEISAGATAVATDEERRAALKAAHQARLAGVRGRHHAQLAAMKQRLPALEAGLQELWRDVGGARRPAPTRVHLRATAAVDKQLEKAETLLLVPTEGNLTEAEGYLGSAREHLEAAEAQLAPAEVPPMSTVKAVAGTPHSGEAGGWRGHHQGPQEQGAGSAMAQGAVTTAPQNTPAEQRAAGEQQTAADRCEREQIGRDADAAHEEQPVNSYQLKRACPEVLQLCVNIQGIQEQLSWALSDDSANAIKSHRQALLSEVEWIEGAAVREARTRGWDLNMIEGLVQEMLACAKSTLRAAEEALCGLEAAHHAACVGDLAGEASEVRDGTWYWSAQGCTEFWEELDWELQAFRKVNTKLELYPMQTVKRQAARLRVERVEAAAHYARQVMERVLWDHDHGWEEPQRFGLDHHQPIHPEESCEQGGRQGVQVSSVADEEGGPQRVVQMEDEIWGLQKWDWYPPKKAEVDSGGWPGGVEAGHSEAWASKPADLARHWLGETEDAPEKLLQREPADLARHWLGETEDAPKELLCTVQEPGEEAGRPRVEAGHSEAWAFRGLGKRAS
jgi:hypothetical protein